jgi:hypothetical protein
VLTYLLKAEGFGQKLKRARAVEVGEVIIRYEKNGRYLIKDANGLILSFGGVN